MLAGDEGAAAKFAMSLIVRTAEISGAEELVDISWAHVASAYYQGQVNLDFAEKLAAMNAQVRVPTTLTACSLDIRQADAKGGAPAVQAALRIVDLYRDMGCQTVMTCSRGPSRARLCMRTRSSARAAIAILNSWICAQRSPAVSPALVCIAPVSGAQQYY
jgi:predicted aconitase